MFENSKLHKIEKDEGKRMTRFLISHRSNDYFYVILHGGWVG